jgi:hypothetical protein
MPNNGSSKFPAGALARPDYRPGDFLLPDDLKTGQHYLQQLLRRHNRMLHGAGVVCGMSVAPANDPTHPWGVYVCPGYAISPYGDEIALIRRELLDISEFLWMYFATPGLPNRAYVGISYAEELVKPLPAASPACQCEQVSYTPSRAMDSYQLSVLWANSEEERFRFTICSDEVVPCQPCPASPYLVLAQVNLPASVGNSIVGADIMNL